MAGKYVNEDSVESERPLKVCAEAGRKCVRSIHQYQILSAEWIALVDSLKQLARLVQLEGRMPTNPKVLETQGRDRDSEGTLWDQETHENAIRILVEEAKVNLCLRMMNDYKTWEFNPLEKQASMEGAIQAYDYTSAQLEQKCAQFEECLGVLLRRAFMHVETLQLMDIPLLITHIELVLRHAVAAPDLGDPKMQSTLALYYFASLTKHAEALNNGELLAKVQETHLVELAVTHYQRFCEQLAPELKLYFAEGLAAMADNEDFQPQWEHFFTEEGSKQNFLHLETTLSGPLLEEKPDRRRDLRPLLDFYRTIQRSC